VAATDGFSSENKLGEGGFGSVYRGFLHDTNLHIAVKKVCKSSCEGWKEFVSVVRTISRLRHRNLVRLVGCLMAAWMLTSFCPLATVMIMGKVLVMRSLFNLAT
jgi:serine/threonine protein kinase